MASLAPDLRKRFAQARWADSYMPEVYLAFTTAGRQKRRRYVDQSLREATTASVRLR